MSDVFAGLILFIILAFFVVVAIFGAIVIFALIVAALSPVLEVIRRIKNPE